MAHQLLWAATVDHLLAPRISVHRQQDAASRADWDLIEDIQIPEDCFFPVLDAGNRMPPAYSLKKLVRIVDHLVRVSKTIRPRIAAGRSSKKRKSRILRNRRGGFLRQLRNSGRFSIPTWSKWCKS